MDNSDTNKALPDFPSISVTGKSIEEVKNKYLEVLNLCYLNEVKLKLQYIRFVPLLITNWRNNELTIFICGFEFYFRYGKDVEFGRYIPFTRLNISVTNCWSLYKELKNKSKENNNG